MLLPLLQTGGLTHVTKANARRSVGLRYAEINVQSFQMTYMRFRGFE